MRLPFTQSIVNRSSDEDVRVQLLQAVIIVGIAVMVG
jgi:hypothetical protein